MQSGSVADWVGAVSTGIACLVATGAAVFAGSAALYAKHAVEIEQRRDALRDADREREQARHIAAWLPTALTYVGAGVEREPGPGETAAQALALVPERLPASVRNASLTPVSDFTLDLYVRASNLEPWRFAGSHYVGLVPPDTILAVEAMSDVMAQMMRRHLQHVGAEEFPPMVALGWGFEDNEGLAWRRRPDEALTRDDNSGSFVLASAEAGIFLGP